MVDEPLANQEPTSPGEAAAEIEPSGSRKRSGRAIIWIIIVVLLLAAAGAGGGYYYVRQGEAAAFQNGLAAVQAGEWEQAVAELDSAAGMQPAFVLQYGAHTPPARGVALYHLGEQERALADLESAVAAQPDDARLRAYYSLLLYDLGRENEAFEASQSALESGAPDLPAGLLGKLYRYRATGYLAEGDLEAAVSEAELALAQGAGDSLVHAVRAAAAYDSLDYEAAREAANTAIELGGAPALAYRVRGALYAWRYDLQNAHADLEAALELDPQDVQARALLVYLASMQEDRQGMRNELEQILALEPESPYAYWAQTFMLREEYDFEAALVSAEKALEMGGERPEFYWLRSSSYYLALDDDKSRQDFEQALALDPGFCPALESRAFFEFYVGEFENQESYIQQLQAECSVWNFADLLAFENHLRKAEWKPAEAALERALALTNDNSYLHFVRGEYYSLRGKSEEARAEFERSLELDPQSVNALLGLGGLALDEQDYPACEEYISQALAIHPQSVSARLLQAGMHVDQEDYEAALAAVGEALEFDPENPSVLLTRGLVKMGEASSDALVDIENVLGRYKNSADAYAVRSSFYIAQGELHKAERDALTALELDASKQHAYVVQMGIALSDSDWEKVIELGKKSIDISAKDSSTYFQMATAYQNMEVSGMAVQHYERAIELDPDIPDYYWGLGTMLLSMRLFEKAQAEIESALEYAEDPEMVAMLEDTLAYLVRIPPEVDGKRTYVDEENKFRITYPANWDLGTPEQTENATLELVPPVLEDVPIYFSLYIDADPGAPASAIVEYAYQNLQFEDKTRLVSQGFQMAGGRGWKLVAKIHIVADDGEGDFIARYYCLVKGGRMVIVIYSAPEYSDFYYGDQADETAASFEFTE